jgi:hypothetical protein
VERILAMQAKPISVLETLADEQRPHLAALLGDTSVSPRPLTDYRCLFVEESAHEPPQNPADPAEPRNPSHESGANTADGPTA